jgi:hypothetical protein
MQYHPFVSTPDNGKCSSCGKGKFDVAHRFSDLQKLSNMLDKDATIRKEMLLKWNEENKPVLESTEENSTTGVFYIQDEWFMATKYANGYHPEELRRIPTVVFQAYERMERGL